MRNIVIGIVTIDDYTNYGNRLQNYALTKILEFENIKVINGIRVYTKQGYVLCTENKIKKMLKMLFPFFLLKNHITPKPRKYDGLLEERRKQFILFTNRYIKTIPVIVSSTYRKAYKLLEALDIEYCIVGSDQVWNPYYQGRDYEFLSFMPQNKRLSFAASIGVENIPNEKKRLYSYYLNQMKYLSVREQRAVEIIKELTGRDADLTLDPTLLLEPDKWNDAIIKPQIPLNANYICTYFLGEIPNAVKLFAEKKGIKIYALNSMDNPELFVLNPGEFLYMIKNASYVLTDSFHAVAFSIKFHKEFYVFDRKEEGVESMFSRIETITKKFNLENRIQNRDCIVEQKIISHWETIDETLLKQKEKSIKRLLDAMEE